MIDMIGPGAKYKFIWSEIIKQIDLLNLRKVVGTAGTPFLSWLRKVSHHTPILDSVDTFEENKI